MQNRARCEHVCRLSTRMPVEGYDPSASQPSAGCPRGKFPTGSFRSFAGQWTPLSPLSNDVRCDAIKYDVLVLCLFFFREVGSVKRWKLTLYSIT